MNNPDTYFMRTAIDEAQKAYDIGEIPVGAVIVHDGKIIAMAHNENRTGNDPTRHAEMLAIQAAVQKFANERLIDCDLYVSKEPCAMCAGAIVHARLKRVIIAARDPKYGACGTVLSVCGNVKLNHVPEIVFGILEEESSSMLSGFFKKLRERHSD